MYCITLLFLVFYVNCKKSTEPQPDVPGKYLIYVKNYSDKMWIGMNREDDFQSLKKDYQTGSKLWIGGAVVKKPELKYGFYFDPETITWGEITVEGMQTTIQQIKSNVDYYVNNGFPNQYAEHAWYIACEILKYQD